MSTKLASEFFRLIIFNNTKEDKLEAYHRVYDTAFKILNVVHQKIDGNLRTAQNQDAMILFQMAVSKSLAIMSLVDGLQYKNSENGNSAIILDPTSIAVLTRTQFEAFSTFHTIFNSSNNQDVITFLHTVWVIAGLKERQNGNLPEHPEFQLKAKKELDIIDKLIINVKTNPIFLNHAIERQSKILDWIEKGKFEMAFRNNNIVLLSQKELFTNAGVNKNFENQYSILSWYIHPSYISVLQFGQMFEKKFNEEQAYTFLHISRIILSMLIIEYCTYFPIAREEFEKQSQIDQLLVYIDNKTYRSEHKFSVNAWASLEAELQHLLIDRLKK
jgi:hypothetical protein